MNEVTLDNIVDLVQDMYVTKDGARFAPLHRKQHEKSGKWRTRESAHLGVRTEWHMRISSETGRHKSTQDFFDDRMEY